LTDQGRVGILFIVASSTIPIFF